eukprot:CAMPEP_0206009288 /NCGR_PEP_ID=MMETSP1464-20131121/9382_1 /ASSEMBLY_ACC=CAM_ASM_001124 /TAXON_ID=119497 /ORGANISM="Exanthemachrysis gayraliae, Strain RCC1523" /LENGTH=50 /DNA_ID=CAMNT_0053382883 /DNA_START=135 /DNA_END=287 /DNA_ORIENTATION=-
MPASASSAAPRSGQDPRQGGRIRLHWVSHRGGTRALAWCLFRGRLLQVPE